MGRYPHPAVLSFYGYAVTVPCFLQRAVQLRIRLVRHHVGRHAGKERQQIPRLYGLYQVRLQNAFLPVADRQSRVRRVGKCRRGFAFQIVPYVLHSRFLVAAQA